MTAPPSITCPLCGFTSYNLNDVEEGYCGNCHLYTRDVVLPATVKALGDPRKDATWTLLPVDTSGGACSQCARPHEPDMPHDRESLAYQYSFYAEHDRWPTWLDAMAHCTQHVQATWVKALLTHGVVVPDD